LNRDRTGPIAGADRDWTTVPLQELIRYLSVDEHSWFRAELSRIDQKLRQLVHRLGADLNAISHLPHVFSQFCRDLQTHMHHEETELFPAITRHMTAIKAGQPLKGSPLNAFGGPLRVMENEHESTGASMRLLRDFGLNYSIPPDCSPEYAEVMELLQNLEDRLLRHMYLENTVLYPRAVALRVALL